MVSEKDTFDIDQVTTIKTKLTVVFFKFAGTKIKLNCPYKS